MTFSISIHFTIRLQAFSPNHVPLPWSGQELRAGPPPLSGACCCSSSSQHSRVAGAEAPMHPPSPPWVPGLLPAVTATSPGIHINTVRTTQNRSQKAKSNHLIALICVLVRSTEHNYILALRRAKKKKRFYFDVLVFASQQYVLKGNYGNLSFQCVLSTSEKNQE